MLIIKKSKNNSGHQAGPELETNNSQFCSDSFSPASVSVSDSGLPWLPKEDERSMLLTHCNKNTLLYLDAQRNTHAQDADTNF